MPIVEFFGPTGTCVTVEMHDPEDGDTDIPTWTLLSWSPELATAQDAWTFVRTWQEAWRQIHLEQVPRPLQHVLEVITLYRHGASTLLECTRRVARAQGHSDDTTVRDAYTRRLGHRHVDDFARLLTGDPADLRAVLHSHYPAHWDVIDMVMASLREGRRP